MRLLILVAIVGMVGAACGQDPPGLPGTIPVEPSHSGGLTSECLEAPPLEHVPGSSGEADRPAIVLAESTGEVDPVNGNVRVCVEGAAAADGIADATCDWDATRSHLRRVSAQLELDGARASVAGLFDPALPPALYVGDAGGYLEPGLAAVPVVVEGDGRSGRIGPVVLKVHEPTDAPVGPLPGVVGDGALTAVLTWRCQPPPPPDPGVARGRVSYWIAPPVDRVLATASVCHWQQQDGQAVVASVNGYTDRAQIAAGRFLGAGVNLLGEEPQVQMLLTTADYTGVGDFEFPVSVTTISERPDRASGRLWVRELTLARGSDAAEDGPPTLPPRFAVDVTWQCERPARAAPPADRGPAPLRDRPGTLSMTVRSPIEARAKGPLRCVLENRPDDLGQYAVAAAGTVEIAGEEWLVDARGEWFTLLRIGPDGSVLAEYAQRWSVGSNDVDVAPLHDTFVRLREPDRPGVVAAPLGRELHPDQLSLSFEIDCRPR